MATHELPSRAEERGFSRRTFLEGIVKGATVLRSPKTAIAFTEAVGAAIDFTLLRTALEEDPLWQLVLAPPDYYSPLGDKRILNADNPRVKRTMAAVGDSIAFGWIEDRREEDAYPATGVVVDIANDMLGFPWEFKNKAKGKATTQTTMAQLELLALEEDKPEDIVISVGGNNIANFLKEPEIMAIIQRLSINPTDIASMHTIVNGIFHHVNEYKKELETIFDKIQALGVESVYILGLPNMSLVTQAHEKSATGEPSSYYLPENPVARFIAQRFMLGVAKHLNNAMKEVADKKQPEVSYQMLYIDTFFLTPGDFTGAHPNEQGQQKIAKEIMGRSFFELPEETDSLLQRFFREKLRTNIEEW